MFESYWVKASNQRLTRRRALAVAGGGALGTGLLAACGSSGNGTSGNSSAADKNSLISQAVDTTKQAKRGGTILYSTASDPAHFDVGQSIAPLCLPSHQVYSRLLNHEPGVLAPTQNKISGDLADSWEFSPDGLQLTLKLRQGVTWHDKSPVDGRALDVGDITFSWDRLVKMGRARSQIANAVNPDAPIVSVTAPDPKTIVVKTAYPLAYLPAILAQVTIGVVTIVPKETDTTFNIAHDMIGTGPWWLSNYQPSVGFTFKRFDRYYDKTRPYADEQDMPIVIEYATGLSQLKAGHLHTYGVLGEDILAVKNETPDLRLFQSDLASTTTTTQFGWLPAGKSPFLDDRVRQAFSMATDRNLFIDATYNVSKFQSQGLPVSTAWNSSISCTGFGDWWLDPQSKDFGPNAKYFGHDVAAAKQLLSAAGYPGGLDVVSNITPNGYGAAYLSAVQILEGMITEAGFRFTTKQHDYVTDFTPNFRDSHGAFEGVSYKAGPGIAQDPVADMYQKYYSKAGPDFLGFDSASKSDHSGDPQIDAMIDKATAELDDNKRKAIVYDLQRYIGGKMYGPRFPGGATGFLVAWPALANFNVQRGDDRGAPYNWWLDATQAPLKQT